MDKITSRVEGVIDKGIEKLCKFIEVSVANQKELHSTSMKMEELASAIHKAQDNVGKNLAAVSDTSSKLTNMVSSYKDVLLTVPNQHSKGPCWNQN